MRGHMQISWPKVAVVFILGMACFLGLVQSIMVTVAWWEGELVAGVWEWIWIGLLPVWVFVYFRYYSIFRPGCRACLPPENRSPAHHDNT